MLEEQVVPWMYDTIMDFLGSDDLVDFNIEDLVSDGYSLTTHAHKEVVDADHEKKEKERIEREKVEKEREEAKEARR